MRAAGGGAKLVCVLTVFFFLTEAGYFWASGERRSQRPVYEPVGATPFLTGLLGTRNLFGVTRSTTISRSVYFDVKKTLIKFWHVKILT